MLACEADNEAQSDRLAALEEEMASQAWGAARLADQVFRLELMLADRTIPVVDGASHVLGYLLDSGRGALTYIEPRLTEPVFVSLEPQGDGLAGCTGSPLLYFSAPDCSGSAYLESCATLDGPNLPALLDTLSGDVWRASAGLLSGATAASRRHTYPDAPCSNGSYARLDVFPLTVALHDPSYVPGVGLARVFAFW